MSLDNLSQLGYGYGCENAETATDGLSHLCYGAPHSLKAGRATSNRCSNAHMVPPEAPCPATTLLLQRPSCRGCDDYAKSTLPSVHARNLLHYRNKTIPTTGVHDKSKPSAASTDAVASLPVSAKSAMAAPAKRASCGCSSGGSVVSPAAEQVMQRERRSRPITVEGKLVDMRCYSMDLRNHGQDHVTPDGKVLEGCASACATAGIPVGVLTGNGAPGGKVYILLTASPQLAQHMNKKARVQGRLMNDSDGVLTSRIQVMNDNTKQYEDVQVVTPM